MGTIKKENDDFIADKELNIFPPNLGVEDMRNNDVVEEDLDIPIDQLP